MPHFNKAFIISLLVHVGVLSAVIIVIKPIELAFRPEMLSLGGVLFERDVMFFEKDINEDAQSNFFNPNVNGLEGHWRWQNYLAVKKEDNEQKQFDKRQYKSPVDEFGVELNLDNDPIEGINLPEIKPHQQLKLHND